MNHFPTEYLILLGNEGKELQQLVTAKNRDEFQPDLKAFLYATKKLKELRSLSLEKGDHEWVPPQWVLNGRDEIVDHDGNIKGYRQIIPLPARPGEPQMALSYDWFWSEFCIFITDKKIWGYKTDRELILILPKSVSFSIEEEWKNFWGKISSSEHLKQSLEIFLNNKTLFKNQAKPWDSNDIPILSEDMATYLVQYYQWGKSRKRHFKQLSIPKAVSDLEEIIKTGHYDTIPFVSGINIEHIKGGDFFLGEKHLRCSSCGEIIGKKEGLKRLALFLKDSDERPQSARSKDDLNLFCKRCVATVFLCPVKLSPETLTVKFKQVKTEYSSTVEYFIQMMLRKFVAQSLHVHAGNFVSLHLDEFVDRKPLVQIFGAYHYTLWKMAVTFPPELFAKGFGVEVYPGEETFTMPQWALWLVSSLVKWENDRLKFQCYRENHYRPHFAQFLRLISRKKIFQAFYVLISGGVIHESYAKTWKMNALQDIWSEFEKILKQHIVKEDEMPIPDYPKIAGFTGLLLPFAERVQSSKAENEKKRAISKLLEEVDRPIQYAYTAARESGTTDFIFCKRPKNRYFFEKAMELLKWAGEDVEALKEEGKKKAEELAEKDNKFSWMKEAEEKIFLCSDQITRVTGALVSESEKPYENEADWRAFAYQVKLALWSMFPWYLGSQD